MMSATEPTHTSPTRRFTPFQNAEILLYGRNKGQTDWNMTGVYAIAQQRTASPPDIACQLWRALRYDEELRNSVRDILLPCPTRANAALCTPEMLAQAYSIDGSVDTNATDPSTDQWPTLTIWTGFEADGVIVPPGEAMWISSADCPTIIAQSPCGMMICAHAGRNSLIDVHHLDHGEPGRPYESVTEAIVATFKRANKDVRELRIFVTCGIGADDFTHPLDHPEFGERNAFMMEKLRGLGWGCVETPLEQGRINLYMVIRHQFDKLGVPSGQIQSDGINTAADMLGDEYLWWSHTRARKSGQPEHLASRNGVLVRNTARR